MRPIRRPSSIRSSATRTTRSTGRSPTRSIRENYNNFYEFGSEKTIADEAQALKIRPWTVKIDGMVEKPFEIGIDDLLKKMPLEERLYRHRCVEAWSMAVPWSGFPMKALVALAKPLGSAKYVRMETFLDADEAPGQKQFWYPWPYIEGMTMAEATNELAFMVTGMYGKPVPKAGRRAAASGVCRGNTASSRSSRSSRLIHRQAAGNLLGDACKATNTASGRTSTPRCRTRAGARRPSACSAPTSAFRH